MKITPFFQIAPRDPYSVYQAGEVMFDQESVNGTSGCFNDPFGRSVPAKDTLRSWRAVGFPLFLSCDDYLALAGDPPSDDWSGHYLRNLREGRTVASPLSGDRCTARRHTAGGAGTGACPRGGHT